MTPQVIASPLNSVDWTRFRDYASFVKSFRVVISETPFDQTSTFRILRAYGIVPVFPNLQHVFISIARSPPEPNLLQCLNCESLTSVDFELQTSPELDDAQPTMQLISTTQELDLTSLSFFTWHPDQIAFPILLSISSAIAAQPNLAELDVLDFHDWFILPFQAGAFLQHLTRISFGRYNPYDEFWPEAIPHTPVAQIYIPGHPSFPSVTSSNLGVTQEGVSDVLAAITSVSLTSLEVMVGPPFLDVVGEGDVPNELVPLPTSILQGRLGGLVRFTVLRSFRFTFATSQLAFVDFAPILACHEMEFACLQGHGLSRWVGDGELQTMAQAWPLLEELVLIDTSQQLQHAHPRNNQGHAPSMTLAGLACLAIHCPQLARLITCVDARESVNTPFPTVIRSGMCDSRTLGSPAAQRRRTRWRNFSSICGRTRPYRHGVAMQRRLGLLQDGTSVSLEGWIEQRTGRCGKGPCHAFGDAFMLSYAQVMSNRGFPPLVYT